jgi:hypothetical protein
MPLQDPDQLLLNGSKHTSSSLSPNRMSSSLSPTTDVAPTLDDSLDAAMATKDDGKHSLLQFAMQYYRKDKFNLSMSSEVNNPKNSSSNADWTWREQMKLVKYSPKPIDSSLIPFHNEQLEKLAIECYHALLKYMESNSDMEVEAVYTILRVRRGFFVLPSRQVFLPSRHGTEILFYISPWQQLFLPNWHEVTRQAKILHITMATTLQNSAKVQ